MKQRLDEAIDDWLRFRASQSISKGTIRRERSCMGQFLAAAGNIYVHQIGESQCTRFFEKGATTKQPQSLRNDHHTLSTFLAWCRATKRMPSDSDPLFGRKVPKRPRKERNRLHVSKFPALLDAAERRSPRDRAAVALLLYTLGRDREIAHLRMRDVSLEAGTIRYTVHKTGEEDHMPICAELDAELRKWLLVYQEDVGHLEPHYFLVPSRRTRPGAGPDGVYNLQVHDGYVPGRRVGPLAVVAGPALAAVGFPVRDENGKSLGEGAHTIRRSGARALFDRLRDQGVDNATEIVQSMLHHATPAMTWQYIGFAPSRARRDTLLRGKTMYELGEVTPLRAHG